MHAGVLTHTRMGTRPSRRAGYRPGWHVKQAVGPGPVGQVKSRTVRGGQSESEADRRD